MQKTTALEAMMRIQEWLEHHKAPMSLQPDCTTVQDSIATASARITQLVAQVAHLTTAARQVLSDIDDDGVAERSDMGVLALRKAVADATKNS
jgi:hypothetical protein